MALSPVQAAPVGSLIVNSVLLPPLVREAPPPVFEMGVTMDASPTAGVALAGDLAPDRKAQVLSTSIAADITAAVCTRTPASLPDFSGPRVIEASALGVGARTNQR